MKFKGEERIQNQKVNTEVSYHLVGLSKDFELYVFALAANPSDFELLF